MISPEFISEEEWDAVGDFNLLPDHLEICFVNDEPLVSPDDCLSVANEVLPSSTLITPKNIT